MPFTTISPSQLSDAYNRGIEDARNANGETDRCSNPFGRRSKEGKAWVDGWNAWVARQFS